MMEKTFVMHSQKGGHGQRRATPKSRRLRCREMSLEVQTSTVQYATHHLSVFGESLLPAAHVREVLPVGEGVARYPGVGYPPYEVINIGRRATGCQGNLPAVAEIVGPLVHAD